MTTGLVWFRRDLRLQDNPAWADATSRFRRLVALWVLDPHLWEPAHHRRREWAAANLAALDASLQRWGGRLRVERGDPRQVVPEVAAEVGAAEVVVNGDVTPYSRRRDAEVAARLRLVTHHGRYIHPPGSLRTGKGDTYQVFTPYWRRWREAEPPAWPQPGEAAVEAQPGVGLPAEQPPPVPAGEEAALDRLHRLARLADRYLEDAPRLDLDATSRLSPDLTWGTLAARTALEVVGLATPGREAWVRQLAWRDFFAQLLWDRPHLVDNDLRPRREPWRHDPQGWEEWRWGRTGHGLIDAGMRQLLAEGWMPNRVRMVAASYLTKTLGIDWRRGERWFRHHLLDADLAQNVGNWQWAAGVGADSRPGRTFNPELQARRYDPDGDYRRRWLSPDPGER